MSADSPRRSSGNASRGLVAVPTIVPPQVVSDRSILDSAIGFINEVTLAHQPHTDPKDTITWARFETAADISDPRFGDDWELEGNVAPPLLLILGYGLGVQVWAIPANGEAVEVLSWRHGIVSALRVLPTPLSSVAVEENGRADEPVDVYAEKRPLIALVDGSSSSGTQPQFCAVNFISLKSGTQVKVIKFKNPVIDVLANRSSIVITFHERIAVFDARTLEDRLSITTCYPSPGINPNPIALGHRWLAYAEHKLIHSKRSGGGCDGEGVASYTATVLNASKSLVKGLRELGEQVAAGLTGTSASGTSSKNTSFDSASGLESKQSGVVTIIDVKNPLRDYSPTAGVPMSSGSSAGTDPIVAHFIAHSEALVSMEFDNSGMLLLTADRRGHDFHVFRIQPNPVGSSLAAVHHLYVLHRGDTSAKVQNISFSLDSRWVAVSTLRGTTHVFPITPYGGPMGVRTHTSLHVVNKLSRFHRSAGLSAEGRSNSPISHSESTTFSLSLQPYHNTTLPPYPRPTVVVPLAQLRQPFALGSPPGSATLAGGKTGPAGQGSGSQRQRLSSLSDDSGKPLSVCAIFAKSRSWLLDPPNVTREAPHRMQRKAVDSLFVMAGHGALIQYDLDTKLASNVAKEKICDDTPIELEVEAKAQWNLGRRKEGSQEIMPPLSMDNWLVKSRNSCMLTDSTRQYDDSDDRGESWLAQVEIVTHAGPHRRLWMGPQFVFKTYNTPSGSNLSHVDIEAVEIGTNSKATTTTAKSEHSSPLNMPLTTAGRSSAVPVLIESGSYSSIEQSPKLMDRFRHDHLDSDFSVAHGDTRLKEDLADAMRESPSVSAASKDSGSRGCETATKGCSNDNIAFYDALADHDDDQDPQDQDFAHNRHASAAALASALPNIYSFDNRSSYEPIDSLKKAKASIEKIVNPLGTVTTVTSCLTAEIKTDILDEVVSQLAAEDTIIHENCDESLFRPVVAIFCDEKTRIQQEEEEKKNQELCQPPENIGTKLIVPVIEKEVDDEYNKKEKQKYSSKFQKTTKEKSYFNESLIRKKSVTKLPIAEKEPCKIEQKSAKPINSITSVGVIDATTSIEANKSPERERSPIHSKIKIGKTSTAKESEEETPVSTAEKHKSLLKKETKRQIQQNKAEEESAKKKEFAKKHTEETGVEDRSKSKESDKTLREKGRETHLEGKLCTKEAIEVTPKPLPLPESDNNTTACVASDENEQGSTSSEFLNKELTHRISETQDMQEIKDNTEPLRTAVSINISAIDKTAIREEIESTPMLKPKSGITKPAKKKETVQSIIKTEKLNVKDLADSLIELKDEDYEAKEITKLEDKTDIVTTPLLEAVDIFTAPSKLSKNTKKKGYKSDSRSEPDEIKDIVKPISTSLVLDKPKSKDAQALKKKSSTSSDESYTDLADSLLKRKDDDLKETMFISFKQIEESRKLHENKIVKEIQDDKLMKPSKSNEFEQDHNKGGTHSKEPEAASLKQQDKDKGKDSTESVKDNDNVRKGNSEEKLENNCLNLEKKSKGKVTKKPEQRKGLLKPSPAKNGTGHDGTVKVENKSKREVEIINEPTKPKCEEEINENCSKPIKQYSDDKESDKNNCSTLKNTTAKVVKSDECGKVKSGALKKTAEKNNENVESSVTPDKSSTQINLVNVESDKDKLNIIRQSLGNTNDIEERDSKKAQAEKGGKNKESGEDNEFKEEFTKHAGSIRKIVSVEKYDDQMILESKSKDRQNKKISPDLKDSSINIETGIPLKEIKKTENDKQSLVKGTIEIESKESKLDEGNDVHTTTAAKKKSPQNVKEIVSRGRKGNDIDIKKTDNSKNTESKKPGSSKEKGVVVEQPRMQQNKELQKEDVMNRFTPKNKDNDVERNVASTKDSLKASPSPSPKKIEVKPHKTEIVKTETATIKSAEKVALKDVKDELSKKVKNKSELDLVSTAATKKSTTASNCKQDSKKENCDKETPSKCLPQDTAKKSLDPSTKPTATDLTPPLPIPCAWKTLSGAEIIAKNLIKKDNRPDDTLFPPLGATAKAPKASEKLLPELPTPKETKEQLVVTKSPSSKKTKISPAIDDFPILQALEPLPPLPTLEPLELLGESKNSNSNLINFESPLQENPALERKITPPPRCFTEQNVIFALCGSLHYENEQRSRATPEKSDASSSNRSSSALDEPSMADYKSLTENDDPYISLEHSSQDTNTTNTHTTNDKFSSSNNSSGTEEIIIMEEKKLIKKQKRKRQQQLLELQKQKELQMQQRHQLDDEELRPLIAMSESQVEKITERVENPQLPSLLEDSFSIKPLITKINTLTYSTTTDSEGPMPVTTSDDNVFIMPSTTTHTQHKIKTKKMEHKFNLIAAIEAATSSSTSSAEESGVEMGGGRSRDNDDAPPLSLSMISAAGGYGSSALPIPMSPVVVGASPVAALSPTVGALKKKTKRRYQFRKDQSGSADTTDGMDKMRNQLNHKKSTADMNNSTHDINDTSITTTTAASALKQKLEMKSLSQDPTLPPQQSTETHNTIYEMKQQQQYLTNNAMDNCFANPDAANMEAATIVNIDIFDDQLSTSSISNTSRFSCETTPLTTTTPPISLNGVIDTNLMHFSHNTTATVVTKGTAAATSGDRGNIKDGVSAHNDNRLAMRSRRHGGGGGGGSGGSADEDEDDDDDDDNSSNGSAGSL